MFIFRYGIDDFGICFCVFISSINIYNDGVYIFWVFVSNFDVCGKGCWRIGDEFWSIVVYVEYFYV